MDIISSDISIYDHVRFRGVFPQPVKYENAPITLKVEWPEKDIPRPRNPHLFVGLPGNIQFLLKHAGKEVLPIGDRSDYQRKYYNSKKLVLKIKRMTKKMEQKNISV